MKERKKFWGYDNAINHTLILYFYWLEERKKRKERKTKGRTTQKCKGKNIRVYIPR